MNSRCEDGVGVHCDAGGPGKSASPHLSDIKAAYVWYPRRRVGCIIVVQEKRTPRECTLAIECDRATGMPTSPAASISTILGRAQLWEVMSYGGAPIVTQ